MVNRLTVELGFWILLVAVIGFVQVLFMQGRAFRTKSALQPIKRLLFGSVLALVVAAVSLMVVYANTLWFHKNQSVIITISIIGNAISKVISAWLLFLIYKAY